MTKKKKNARERRALVGALCTAAVIIAGSTFAWFTSEDEVTNRLTASADYGVSIVESFTPPKNWIPGSKINKDVYATNTGNIGAYVEEDVSGVLTITTEKPETNWSADCVELTEEERYVMEAGAFLAYKPAGDTTNVLGNQVVIRPADQGTTPKTDFTPNADGLYVFRRSIGVDSTTRAETFEYEGYHYSGGKYYKVELTSVTPDTVGDLANDGVTTDGNLTNATASYFKEVSEVVKNVNLAYQENPTADYTGNYLVATYDTGNSKTSDLVALAQAYDDAIAAYERAAEAVNRATADSGTTGSELANKKAALDAAYQALQAALEGQRTANTNLANATAAYNTALAEKTAAQEAVDTSKTKLYGGTNKSESDFTDDSLKGKYTAAANAKVNATGRDQFEADFNTWATSDESHKNAKGTTTLADYTYEEFMDFVPEPDGQVYYEKVAAEKLAKEAYEAELAKLIGSTAPANANSPTADSLQGKLNAANTALGDADSGATKEKNDAQTAKDNADSAVGTKQGEYDSALAAYTAALNASNSDTGNLETAKAALASATSAMNAAEAAYNKANGTAASDGILKIYIKLSDAVVTAGGTEADKWQLLPVEPLSASGTGLTGNVAKFYYTSILAGGATSSKLIESVELDKNATQDMYKSFDFDLNVALKSAQIAYDTDNTTLLTTPANETLDADATLVTPTSETSAITWNAKP